MKRYLFLLLIIFQNCLPVVVGSDTAVSRQQRVFFPQVDIDNRIQGFTAINNGFTLENNLTQCIYDAFFPISGDALFNRGALVLNQNIEFKSPLQLGVGTIQANGFSILFPDNLSLLNVPNVNHNRLLVLEDQLNLGTLVNSVGWSWDNKYVAAVTSSSLSNPELHVYRVETNLTLTLVASSNVFGNNTLDSVAWHPNTYILATGQMGLLTDQVRTFSFDEGGGALTQLDSDSLLIDVNAVSWSPTGNYLAVGSRLSASFRVYPVTNGILGTPIISPLASSLLVQPDAVSWHSSEDYLAVGFFNSLTILSEVKIFDFDGSSLVQAGSLAIVGSVNTVAWRPNDFVLAVGHAASGNRIQLYDYNPTLNTLTEQVTARPGQQLEPYSFSWDSSGQFLLVGLANATTENELEVYHYDTNENYLFKTASYPLNNTVKSVRFEKGDSSLLVTGDSGSKLSLFSFDLIESTTFGIEIFAFTFTDAKIFVKSDITLRGPILFQGNCVVNGASNTLDLGDNGSIVVDVGGNLVLEDMILKGAQGTNIRCKDDQSSIVLHQLHWQQDSNYSFTTGSFNIKDDVRMTGESVFSYASLQPFTIDTQSSLFWQEGFTFNYINTSPSLIHFTDRSSQLILNDCTLSIPYGLEFTKGILRVEGSSLITTNTSGGISLGDGTSANDFELVIAAGEVLNISGAFKYKNTDDALIKTVNTNSRLAILDNSRFELFENLTISAGAIEFYNNTVLARALNKNITGSILIFGALTYEDL